MIRDLTYLSGYLNKFDLLESQGKLALRDAIAQLEGGKPADKSKRSGAGLEAWKFEISPKRSLRFTLSSEGSEMQPDLFCRFSGPSKTNWPWDEQSVVIRLWSTRKDLTARAEYDSKKVIRMLEKRNWERVVVRMHFDKASIGDKEPIFHLQFGGTTADEARELCWFPTQINVPRLPYHPLDLVLASELIIANFFPSIFDMLKKEPEWRALVARSQHNTMKRYTEVCQSCCAASHAKDDKTLFMNLLNA
jgi:hypothetical protein